MTTDAWTMLFKVRTGVCVISTEAFSNSIFHSMAANFFSIGKANFWLFLLFMSLKQLSGILPFKMLFPENNIAKIEIFKHLGLNRDPTI